MNRTVAASVILLGMSFAAAAVRAERPPAPELLPEKTFVLVRVSDSRELVARFKEFSIGRMFQDELMQPLVAKLYGGAVEAFGRVEGNVGLPLEQLLAIPQGEVALAVVPTVDAPPSAMLLIDVGDQMPAAQKLLARAQESLDRAGATTQTEKAGDVEIKIVSVSRRQTMVFAQRETTILVATHPQVIRQALAFWDGKQAADMAPLSQNRKFTTILSRCQSGRDERPHITAYVDPIDLVKESFRGNTAAQTGLAVLPALGLDGLQAIGGSVTLAPGEFDSILHGHLLLDNPRSGVIKALALDSGDTTPELWAPHDLASYTTLHWDFETTRVEVARLVDMLRGDGSFASLVKQRLSEPLGIDFEKEVFSALAGRVTLVHTMEKPYRWNSRTTVLAVQLKDPAAFRPTLDKVVEKFADRLEKKSFGGVGYHRLNNEAAGIRPPGPPLGASPAPDGARIELTMRTPEICFGLLGDYWIAADSESALQQCITAKSDPDKSLAGALDFKLLASKMGRQAGGRPGMISFDRPEEGLRMAYEMISSDATRKNLAVRAESNGFFKVLSAAFHDQPLPPFSAISKYFAPVGATVVNDETGYHYTAFGLKRK